MLDIENPSAQGSLIELKVDSPLTGLAIGIGFGIGIGIIYTVTGQALPTLSDFPIDNLSSLTNPENEDFEMDETEITEGEKKISVKIN